MTSGCRFAGRLQVSSHAVTGLLPGKHDRLEDCWGLCARSRDHRADYAPWLGLPNAAPRRFVPHRPLLHVQATGPHPNLPLFAPDTKVLVTLWKCPPPPTVASASAGITSRTQGHSVRGIRLHQPPRAWHLRDPSGHRHRAAWRYACSRSSPRTTRAPVRPTR